MREHLGEKTNWTDSDELALMFRNTYRPEFYKVLHRYVHSVYRQLKALNVIKDALAKPFAIRAGHIKTLLKLPYYSLSVIQHKIKLDRVLR